MALVNVAPSRAVNLRDAGSRTPRPLRRLVKGASVHSKRTTEDRFWAKVDRRGPDECWIWTAASSGRPGKKYGRIWAGKRSLTGRPLGSQAHRVAYEMFVGPIPQGLQIDHLCRTTLCVNPAHLEPVTYEENQRRGNSPMAQQARQTHCKRGHPLDEANTYVWHRMRRCRRCNNDQQAAIRSARRTR